MNLLTELLTAVVAVAVIALCGADVAARRLGKAVRHGV